MPDESPIFSFDRVEDGGLAVIYKDDEKEDVPEELMEFFGVKEGEQFQIVKVEK